MKQTVGKYCKQREDRAKQRHRKAEKRLNSGNPIREPFYQPPALRGLRVYGDLDMGYLRIIYISMWDCGRIDSFYIRNEDPRTIGQRPKLEDSNDWWVDGSGNRKKYGKVNLDKAIREMQPNIRRME